MTLRCCSDKMPPQNLSLVKLWSAELGKLVCETYFLKGSNSTINLGHRTVAFLIFWRQLLSKLLQLSGIVRVRLHCHPRYPVHKVARNRKSISAG